MAPKPMIKIKLPELEFGKSYRSWRGKLVGQMKQHDAWDGVRDALADENEVEPMWDLNAAAGVLAIQREAYKTCYTAMSESIKLDSEVDQLLVGHSCEDVISSLRLLDGEYLDLQCIDINTISDTFNKNRWDYKKGKLSKWITEKHAQVLKLSEEYPTDASRNRALCRVLCDQVPDHFNVVTGKYRTKAGADWKKLAAALRDHEKAHPMSKGENNTKAMNTKIEELEKQLKDQKAEIKANYNNNTVWDDRKRGNKGNKKGRGKKGKGKHGQGGRPYRNPAYDRKNGRDKKPDANAVKKAEDKTFDDDCRNCGGYGHSALFCTSGKTMKELKKLGF